MKRQIDKLMQALILIRFGQELGTATPAAHTIHQLLELLVSLPVAWFR